MVIFWKLKETGTLTAADRPNNQVRKKSLNAPKETRKQNRNPKIVSYFRVWSFSLLQRILPPPLNSFSIPSPFSTMIRVFPLFSLTAVSTDGLPSPRFVPVICLSTHAMKGTDGCDQTARHGSEQSRLLNGHTSQDSKMAVPVVRQTQAATTPIRCRGGWRGCPLV